MDGLWNRTVLSSKRQPKWKNQAVQRIKSGPPFTTSRMTVHFDRLKRASTLVYNRVVWMIIQCGSRPWTFGQTVVSDRPVSSIWTVILELIPFTWDLSWLKVQQLIMSMSMSSMNLVFLFLSTWHQRFLEAVAFFDLIGGARQGHWDKFQSAVSNHLETRLLIGSIHFLHLTFESISKPIQMSRVSHNYDS